MADGRGEILIVDDDEDTCVAFSDILADCGYGVDFGCNGEDALALTDRTSYRLALLDLRLAGMSGIELFDRMRRLRQGIVGILITAFLTADAEAAAESAGVQQILLKPIDVSDLLPLIHELLTRL